MARIAKRRIKGRTYYYLEHTSRDEGKRVTRKRYLGGELPKDIDDMKKSFLSELDEEKWFGDFGRIKQGYSAELETTPKSARGKALREFSVRFTYNTQRIEVQPLLSGKRRTSLSTG